MAVTSFIPPRHHRHPSARRGAAQRSNQAPSSAALGTKPKAIGASDPRFLSGYNDWQAKAKWAARVIGAVNFGAGIVANACGRCELLVEEQTADGEWVPTEDAAMKFAMREYRSERLSTGELVRLHGWHYQVAGEMIQLVRTAPSGVGTDWSIYSRSAVEFDKPAKGEVLVYDEPGGTLLKGTAWSVKRDAAFRLWIPDEEWQNFATSPMVAAIEALERYWALVRTVKRDAESRLAGNGVWWTPSEAHDSFETDDDGNTISKLDTDFIDMAGRAFADDDDILSVAPFPMHTPGSKDGVTLPTPEYIEMGRKHDPESLDYRKEALADYARGIDVPGAMIESGGPGDANHWCADAETEVLTRNGWVTHDRLAPGDEVLTLNHASGLSEWQPVERVYRADVVDEPMIAMESRFHSSLTTPAHRWPVLHDVPNQGRSREWTTSAEMRSADRIITGAPCADLPAVAKYDDAFVELVAWYWTEGHQRPGKAGVSIAQSHTVNPARVDRIRAALTRLYGDAGWSEHVQRNESSYGGPVTVFSLRRAAAEPIVAAAPGKRVSPEFVLTLTAAQLELFIDISCQGDGHHYGREVDIWQRDPAALDAFELALILSGRATSKIPAHQDGTRVCGYRRPVTAVVKAAYESERRSRPGASRSEVRYTGTVWCPTTPNGSWLARRRGRTFYTGNSEWLISDKFWDSGCAPTMNRICHSDLTTTYVQPYAANAGRDPSRFRLGYDPSPVIVRPDQSDIALKLYLAGLLGEVPTLLAANFNEAERMTVEERVRLLEVLSRGGAPMTVTTPIGPSNVEKAPPSQPDVPPASIAPLPVAAAVAPARLRTAAPEPAVSAPTDLERANRVLRKIAAVRRETGLKLLGAAEASLASALAEAGKRIVRHANSRKPSLKSATAAAVKRGQALRTVMGALGIDEEAALSRTFDVFAVSSAALLAQADRRERAILLDADYEPDEFLPPASDRRSEMASGFLVASLTTLARQRLVDGPIKPSPGEAQGTVPATFVAKALRVNDGRETVTLPITPDAHPTLDKTNVYDIDRRLAASTGAKLRYRWEYGFWGAPNTPFLPHEDIGASDIYVDDPEADDPVLANTEAWPDASYFYPGDHDGCSCEWLPELVPPDEG